MKSTFEIAICVVVLVLVGCSHTMPIDTVPNHIVLNLEPMNPAAPGCEMRGKPDAALSALAAVTVALDLKLTRLDYVIRFANPTDANTYAGQHIFEKKPVILDVIRDGEGNIDVLLSGYRWIGYCLRRRGPHSYTMQRTHQFFAD